MKRNSKILLWGILSVFCGFQHALFAKKTSVTHPKVDYRNQLQIPNFIRKGFNPVSFEQTRTRKTGSVFELKSALKKDADSQEIAISSGLMFSPEEYTSAVQEEKKINPFSDEKYQDSNNINKLWEVPEPDHDSLIKIGQICPFYQENQLSNSLFRSLSQINNQLKSAGFDFTCRNSQPQIIKPLGTASEFLKKVNEIEARNKEGKYESEEQFLLEYNQAIIGYNQELLNQIAQLNSVSACSTPYLGNPLLRENGIINLGLRTLNLGLAFYNPTVLGSKPKWGPRDNFNILSGRCSTLSGQACFSDLDTLSGKLAAIPGIDKTGPCAGRPCNNYNPKIPQWAGLASAQLSPILELGFRLYQVINKFDPKQVSQLNSFLANSCLLYQLYLNYVMLQDKYNFYTRNYAKFKEEYLQKYNRAIDIALEIKKIEARTQNSDLNNAKQLVLRISKAQNELLTLSKNICTDESKISEQFEVRKNFKNLLVGKGIELDTYPNDDFTNWQNKLGRRIDETFLFRLIHFFCPAAINKEDTQDPLKCPLLSQRPKLLDLFQKFQVFINCKINLPNLTCNASSENEYGVSVETLSRDLLVVFEAMQSILSINLIPYYEHQNNDPNYLKYLTELKTLRTRLVTLERIIAFTDEALPQAGGITNVTQQLKSTVVEWEPRALRYINFMLENNDDFSESEIKNAESIKASNSFFSNMFTPSFPFSQLCSVDWFKSLFGGKGCNSVRGLLESFYPSVDEYQDMFSFFPAVYLNTFHKNPKNETIKAHTKIIKLLIDNVDSKTNQEAEIGKRKLALADRSKYLLGTIWHLVNRATSFYLFCESFASLNSFQKQNTTSKFFNEYGDGGDINKICGTISKTELTPSSNPLNSKKNFDIPDLKNVTDSTNSAEFKNNIENLASRLKWRDESYQKTVYRLIALNQRNDFFELLDTCRDENKLCACYQILKTQFKMDIKNEGGFKQCR